METTGSKRTDACNEKELVRRILEGDRSSEHRIYDMYFERLKNYILNALTVNDETEAEDIAHETLIKAFSSLESYNDAYSFSTWLYAIAKNKAIDFLRKRESGPESVPIDSLSDTHFPEGGDSPEDDLVKIQDRELIETMLEQIPEKYKRAVDLKLQGYAYEEIAQKLGIKISDVKNHLFRAKKLLIKTYHDYGKSD